MSLFIYPRCWFPRCCGHFAEDPFYCGFLELWMKYTIFSNWKRKWAHKFHVLHVFTFHSPLKMFQIEPTLHTNMYKSKGKKAAAMMHTETFNAWQTFPRLSLLQTNRIIVWKIRWSLAERLWCTDHQRCQIHTEIWQKSRIFRNKSKAFQQDCYLEWNQNLCFYSTKHHRVQYDWLCVANRVYYNLDRMAPVMKSDQQKGQRPCRQCFWRH